MNPLQLFTIWSFRKELIYVTSVFLITLLIPVIAVILLTNSGIDIISDRLATQNPQTHAVEIHDPATGKYLPFQAMSQRIKRKYGIEAMAKKFPVEMHAFDVLYYNGKSLFDAPFKERRSLLEKIIKEKKKALVLAKHLVTADEKVAEQS